jgi:hypothetical protein
MKKKSTHPPSDVCDEELTLGPVDGTEGPSLTGFVSLGERF